MRKEATAAAEARDPKEKSSKDSQGVDAFH
jgi:hypothetical protein